MLDEPGVDGRIDGWGCGGLAAAPTLTEGLRSDGAGAKLDTFCAFWARAEVDRLKGLRRAGYACRSRWGTGGASMVVDEEDLLPALLKAFRNDANDDFFVNGDGVVTEVCDECAREDGVLGLVFVVCVVWENDNEESSDALESPRE